MEIERCKTALPSGVRDFQKFFRICKEQNQRLTFVGQNRDGPTGGLIVRYLGQHLGSMQPHLYSAAIGQLR